MVDRFNDYFVNVSPNLANKIALESGSHLDYINSYNNNNMFVLPVTPSEICDITATFKSSKSAGYDSISSNVIKSIINTFKSNKSAGYDSISPVIKSIINIFKSNKSPGYDSISPSVSMSIIKNIALPLCDVFNQSLLTGCFSNKLKIAKVIPLYKILINNYRPISVLPVFSKILERLMYKRLLDFLNKNEILVKKQFGFREKHSTYMAIYFGFI